MNEEVVAEKKWNKSHSPPRGLAPANKGGATPSRKTSRPSGCAVFHDDARRRRWIKRQRHIIFRLLLQRFGQMIGNTTNGHHPRPATLWRLTVESWLRCRGLILIRQNQNVSTTFPKIWSHN